jgi:hypothetical protein
MGHLSEAGLERSIFVSFLYLVLYAVVALAILSLLAEAIWAVSRKPDWERSVEFKQWRRRSWAIEDKEPPVVDFAREPVLEEVGISQSVQL